MHSNDLPVKLDRPALRAPDGRARSAGQENAVGGVGRRTALLSNDLPMLVWITLLFGPAVSVTVYGLIAGRVALVALGFAALALAASALGLVACVSIRTLERRSQRLGRAREESERARHHLELENARLRQRLEQLEAREAAIDDGFDWIDEQTAGRLRALLDAAGLELADLAYMELDDDEEQA